MSKQDFTDTLKYGKCACGNAGTEPRTCEKFSADHCNCCASCRQKCPAHEHWMEQAVEYMSRIAEEEVREEVERQLREQEENSQSD